MKSTTIPIIFTCIFIVYLLYISIFCMTEVVTNTSACIFDGPDKSTWNALSFGIGIGIPTIAWFLHCLLVSLKPIDAPPYRSPTISNASTSSTMKRFNNLLWETGFGTAKPTKDDEPAYMWL